VCVCGLKTMNKKKMNLVLSVFAMAVLWGSGTAWAAPSTQDGISLYRHFFVSGGPIVWFILLPMSIAVLYLALDLCMTIRRKRLLPSDLAGAMAAHTAQYGTAGLAERFGRRPALVSRVVIRALARSEAMHSGPASVRQFAAESLQEIGQNLLRKAEWCQILGGVAPMVGLFGTVLGMIQAFTLLGIADGQPAYDELAAAISVALVTTFWGLLAAIPALFLYGVFRSRIETFLNEAAVETDILLGQIFKIQAAKRRSGDKVGGSQTVQDILYETEPLPS